jgi:hypothetical protein
MRFVPIVFAAAMLAVIAGESATASDSVVRCGQVSDIKPSSFVLTASDTAPLRVKIPAGKQVQLSSYVCVSVVPGSPAQLDALLAPGMLGYEPEH